MPAFRRNVTLMPIAHSALQDQLDKLRATLASNAPDFFAALDDNIAQLVRTEAPARALAVGDRAPDFDLPAAAGGRVRLVDLPASGPVVVTFFRGEWCPFCDLMLRTLQSRLTELASARATLVAVSPQTLEHSGSTAEVKGLTFPVLSDLGNETDRAYGLVYSLTDAVRRVYAEAALDLSVFNGDQSYEMPMPATYVIGVDGVVKWAFIDADFTRRPDPDQLVAALSSISELV